MQAIKGCPLNFDMPFTALQFAGVPYRQSVIISPCERALVSVADWPPFCLDLDSIDIAVFERLMPQLKEFDVVFVLKDYDQPPIRITTVPSQKQEIIRTWLTQRDIPLYTCSMNMQWATVMKDINSDRQAFVGNDGWDAWFMQSDDEVSASCSEDEEADDYGSADISEDSDAAPSSSGEEAWEGSSSEQTTSGESEPSDALSFDELERQAEHDDRKRAVESRGGSTAKRPRR